MEENSQHKEKMHRENARVFVNRYRCSTCWGFLARDVDKDNPTFETVHCEKPDCTGAGFVTAKFVTRHREENELDYREAKRNLGEALGLPNPYKNQTVDEHLKALGF